MPPKLPTQQMGELHERALAESFSARKTTSSGNQWHDQGDVRNKHDLPFAFCLDGKSTLGKSITVTLEMIAKIREQAQGERPGFGLRWYGTTDLKTVLEDFVLLQLADVEEMLSAARAFVELQAAIGGDLTAESVNDLLADAQRQQAELATVQGNLESARATIRELSAIQGEMETLQADLEEERRRRLAQQAQLDQLAGAAQTLRDGGLDSLRGHIIELTAERDRYKSLAEGREHPYGSTPAVPGFVPRLPWTVIHIVRTGGSQVRSGIYYSPQGYQTSFTIGEVRIERTALNRPKLMVNDVRVRDGDLYVDGVLQARASSDRSIAEKG